MCVTIKGLWPVYVHHFLEVMETGILITPLCENSNFHGELFCSLQRVSNVEVDDIPGKSCSHSQQSRDLEHELENSPCAVHNFYFCAEEDFFL